VIVELQEVIKTRRSWARRIISSGNSSRRLYLQSCHNY
jgi:hypothetical protein